MSIIDEVQSLKNQYEHYSGHSLRLVFDRKTKIWVIMLRINDPAETNYEDVKYLSKEEAALIYKNKLLPVWFSSQDEVYRLFIN